MTKQRQSLGERGEQMAEKHLQKCAHEIVEKNYRCRLGEIDLISLDKKTKQLCFTEVKTRTDEDLISPEAAVNHKKQQRIKSIARHYLKQNKIKTLSPRFDVIAIIIPTAGEVTLRHHQDCF